MTADQNRQPLHVLLIEDRTMDAELIVDELRRAGFDPIWHRVENETEYLAALNLEPALDVILADFTLPGFDAPRALDLLKERGLDVPFIVVSGSIGEETAAGVVKSGAADYLLKDRLTRLGQAVQRAIDERRLLRSKREAEQALSAMEERMRFALEASRVGIWEADITTGAAHWSETLEALHGMAAGTFGGTFAAFLDCIHPEDRPEAEATIERATREHTDSNILYRTQWPDGTIHLISGIGRSVYDETGRPLRAAGIGLDVTERQHLQEQLRQAQKMEAIGRLAGGIAHDFNNLLTAMSGFTELVLLTLDDTDSRHADLLEVRKAAERAATLIRQLLAFGRRQMLLPQVLDVNALVAGTETLLRRTIREDIELVMALGVVDPVRVDASQLEQVLLNLALNAQDAMPKGGQLRFLTETVDVDEAWAQRYPSMTSGRYVHLTVSDTGVGMSPETQARVFEPFFTTKLPGKGTGLGLATVYGIVKQSGGFIWVESQVGQGTSFAIYFPAVDAPIEPLVRVVPTGPVRGGSETILLAEDDGAVRRLAKHTLSYHGYTVLEGRDGDDALAVARQQSAVIHLLITDVVMPGLSGPDLAAHLQKERPAMRVLYTSGYADNITARAGVEHGVPVLGKPFLPMDLLRKVREVLETTTPSGRPQREL